MAKLKKTLPKNFRELIVNEDWETLKAELKKCEPNAYERGGISHIMFFKDERNGKKIYLPKEMVEWLIVENHYSINSLHLQQSPIEHLSTALCFYTKVYQIDCVKLLLKMGENPNIGRPLSFAVREHLNDAVSLLLEYGAEVNNPENGTLGMAVFYYNLEGTRLLLEYGANPNLRTNTRDYTALESLLRQYLWNVLNRSPSLQKFTRDIAERYFVDKADVILGIVKLLVDYGADIKSSIIQDIMQKLHQQFYEIYVNKYVSSPEVEEKMEQFELKLYELMQFEPN